MGYSPQSTMFYNSDIEKPNPNTTTSDKASGSGSSATAPIYIMPSHTATEPYYGDDKIYQRSIPVRIFDSFRRDPNLCSTPAGIYGANGRVFDPQVAAVRTATTGLLRTLKGRHLQMIAIGGSIGTGLFVASGQALAGGGPASLLIAFSMIGIMLYCTVHALGEMAVLFPISGSFSAYSTRFIDPAWGFAMGWNYAMQWLVVLPLEIIAASITIGYWNRDLDHAIFVTVFFVLIVGINLFGVKGYGEAEFIFAIVKIVAVIGFILLGIIINIGGGTDSGYIGGRYWNDPGAFNHGFKGLCSVFVTAAFAFGGTELVGLAAAETANPRKSLPTACKQVFWRITLFYIVSLIVVGLNVPYTDARLLSGSGGSDATASPFVIAINDAGIDVLPSIMNVVILIAVLSVGNSAIFGSSRTLASLADQGQAPKIFAYVDRKGRPLVAIIGAAAIGLLAYTADSGDQANVLAWMLALSGLSSIFTWGSICFAHIRFRAGWAYHGHHLDELAFRSQPGLIGSWIGFIFNVLVLIAQFWTGVWPSDYDTYTLHDRLVGFFQVYLAAPVVLLMYLCYKFWVKTHWLRVQDMDMITGQRDLDLGDILVAEREERAGWPAWKKAYKLVC